jgi:acetyl esterase
MFESIFLKILRFPRDNIPNQPRELPMATFPSSFQDAARDPPALSDDTAEWLRTSLTARSVDEDVAAIESAIAGDYSALHLLREPLAATDVHPDVTASDRTLPGPAGDFVVRCFRATAAGDSPTPVLLFFHGGGWIYGSVNRWNARLSHLALSYRLEVHAVEYSRSPEAPPGIAVSEAYIAWRSIESGRFVIVAGDSAGGNLAAALPLKIAQEDPAGRQPDAAFLLYPVADLVRLDYPSYSRYAEGYALDRRAMRAYVRGYVPDEKERQNPLYSPLYGDLSRFPPALVITAEFDILRDEGLALARAIAGSGGSVRYRCAEGAIHGFYSKAIPSSCAVVHEEFPRFLELVHVYSLQE